MLRNSFLFLNIANTFFLSSSNFLQQLLYLAKKTFSRIFLLSKYFWRFSLDAVSLKVDENYNIANYSCIWTCIGWLLKLFINTIHHSTSSFTHFPTRLSIICSFYFHSFSPTFNYYFLNYSLQLSSSLFSFFLVFFVFL